MTTKSIKGHASSRPFLRVATREVPASDERADAGVPGRMSPVALRTEVNGQADGPRAGPGARDTKAATDVQGSSGCAELVLGLDGRIRSCSEAAGRLLVRDPAALLARQVRDVLPGLRLGSRTPAYNIAFIAFGHPDANWREQNALGADGHPIELEAAIALMPSTGGGEFVVGLRRRAREVVHDLARCTDSAQDAAKRS